jgi:calcineurin-like phosphoesterase family protein
MTTFLISDTHFGHEAILNFKNSDGSSVRSFSSVEEMDEIMVENWNKVVGHGDKVYHLGDVVMSKRSLPILSRLNGKKTLIAGNHDIFDTKEYMKYFKNVRGYRVIEDNFILSHIPIHKDSIERYGCNIHGHLHAEVMNDPSYFCVSVEQINYTPIALEEIKFIRENNEK